MFKLSAIVLLVFAVYYTQCLPTSQNSESHTKAKTGERLHFYVNNGTSAVNYQLSPVIHELEVEDQEINTELSAILPHFNFLFDPDKGEDGLMGCYDQLEVQLVEVNNI